MTVDRVVVSHIGYSADHHTGAVLTDRTAIASYYRALMNKKLNPDEQFTPESYTDERLLRHLDSIELPDDIGDNDEKDHYRVEQLMDLALQASDDDDGEEHTAAA